MDICVYRYEKRRAALPLWEARKLSDVTKNSPARVIIREVNNAIAKSKLYCPYIWEGFETFFLEYSHLGRYLYVKVTATQVQSCVTEKPTSDPPFKPLPKNEAAIALAHQASYVAADGPTVDWS